MEDELQKQIEALSEAEKAELTKSLTKKAELKNFDCRKATPEQIAADAKKRGLRIKKW